MPMHACTYAQAIEENTNKRCQTFSAPNEYQTRVDGYKKLLHLKLHNQKHMPTTPTALLALNSTLYAGTRTGNILVYSENLAFREQFRAHNFKVDSIFAYNNTLLAMHEDGVLLQLNNKHGTTTAIPNYRKGVFHPFLPLCIVGTPEHLQVYDFAQSKVISQLSESCARPVAIHPYGGCLILGNKSPSIVDLRMPQKVAYIEKPKYITAGIFHSSGVDLSVSHTNGISVIDIRNYRCINQIKEQEAPTVFHEFNRAVFYSSPNTYVKSVCPITSTSLFTTQVPATSFTSTPTSIYFSNTNKTLERWSVSSSSANTVEGC